MKQVVLIILDGWGIAPKSASNTISQAKLPFIDSLYRQYPYGKLQASGEYVGLPKGEDGNTETGHLNLGAGYVVNQDLQRINLAIADGSFFQNRAFLGAIDHARKYDSNLHILGLVGSGGVHSNTEHLLALLQLIREQNYNKVFLHLVTDGRDSPPKSALLYLNKIQDYLNNIKIGQIATVMGRFYAMDRDSRWDRTQKAYQALTGKNCLQAENIQKIIQDSYTKGITDEFIVPTAIVKDGQMLPRIQNFDSVIFFNYRIDRPRQLTKAFVLDNFENAANDLEFDPYMIKYYKKHQTMIPVSMPPFKRDKKISHLYFVTMTEYSQSVHASAVVFPPHIVVCPLGECLANNNLKQLHISESEKERFVTYYFNGQREVPFDNQDTVIIPSPKVATYDLQPEMSAYKLTNEFINRFTKKKYDFTVLNFANADMVAHTGNINATVKACETLDDCLSKIIPAVLNLNGTLLITADHGNAEELIDKKTSGVDTEHSANPVPLWAVSRHLKGKNKRIATGILADIAPTVLALMNLKKPKSMTGRNLLKNIV